MNFKKMYKEEKEGRKYIVVVNESNIFDFNFLFSIEDDLISEYPELIFTNEYKSREVNASEIEYLFFYE